MTEPTLPPPLELSREDTELADGRYLLYYTFAPAEAAAQEEETPSCPS
jgi:hypothetical protein